MTLGTINKVRWSMAVVLIATAAVVLLFGHGTTPTESWGVRALVIGLVVAAYLASPIEQFVTLGYHKHASIPLTEPGSHDA